MDNLERSTSMSNITIKTNLNTFSEIREAAVDIIKQNRSEYPVLSSYPNDISNQILDVLSGLVTLNNYKYQKLKDETYIHTAVMRSSVLARARELSYNVHRKSCPIVTATTNKDMRLNKGNVVGKLTDNGVEYPIIYFGDDLFFSEGSEVELCVGFYNEFLINVSDTDYTKRVSFNIEPDTENLQVDDIHYTLYKNKEHKIHITKIAEDYTTLQYATEFTTDRYGIDVWVGEHNENARYGVQVTAGDTLTLKYIETTGKMDNLHNIIIDKGYDLIPELGNLKATFIGYNEERTEKVARLAPLLYSTAKRAVTLKDHEVIANTFPLIRDCYAQMMAGKCCTLVLNYIHENAGKSNVVFTDYEIQRFADFFDQYTLGVDVELYPAVVRNFNLTFIVYLKAGVRPEQDLTGAFEATLRAKVQESCNKYNLQLGKTFSVGAILADVYKNFPFVDGYVIDTDTKAEVNPSLLSTVSKNEYLFITSDIKIVADNEMRLR